MRYGERLRKARGEMTQARLSEISGVSQSLISQLENSPTASGSEYTNRLARALDVSPDWLADELGEMKQPGIYVSDPKLVATLKIMEALPEYGKDSAIKEVAEIAKLIEQVKANGTDGPE